MNRQSTVISVTHGVEMIVKLHGRGFKLAACYWRKAEDANDAARAMWAAANALSAAQVSALTEELWAFPMGKRTTADAIEAAGHAAVGNEPGSVKISLADVYP